MAADKLSDLPDEALMIMYQAGDFRAFETLYRRHSGQLFGYIRKKVQEQVAAELLQEVFKKLHRSRGQYNNQYPFLPWIFTIARNTLFDFYREKETKLSRTSFSEPLDHLAQEPEKKDFAAGDIEKILAKLPENQKRAIKLRYLEDWSFEDIAREIRTSEENVRQLIVRGLKRLRLEFAGEKGD